MKVTWHGYAQGTYTGPAALDLLLGALPGRAVVLEGHTSSRNVGGADIDWETDAARHRTWVRQQDVEFLRRTGLAEVIARHGAQYLNVTEAWWDGACAPAEDVRAALGDVALQNPELAGFVPSALMELRGTPLISFARFKGPTRLGISNLFGLIPHPLRTAWHGPDITALRVGLLRPGPALRVPLPPVRFRGGASTRPCAGTARGCTAAVGGITTWSSPTGSSR